MYQNPMEPRLLPIMPQAKLAILGIVAIMAVNVIMLILTLLNPYAFLYGRIYRGGEQAFFLFTALFVLVITVLGVVAYCKWKYRAFENLRIAGLQTEFTPGWAVGWYFIPLANYVQPVRAMSELYKGSIHVASDEKQFNWQRIEVPTVIYIWWGSWLVQPLIAVMVAMGDVNMSTHLNFEIVSEIANVVCGIMVIKLIKNISTMQMNGASGHTQILHQGPETYTPAGYRHQAPEGLERPGEEGEHTPPPVPPSHQ